MNGGNEFGASVYSEAKSEYTKQLTLFILTPFHRFFMESLSKATEEEPNSRKVLSHFQDILSEIPEWNIDKVERETNKIIAECRCDYLEELVTAVFIAHTKILTAIRLSNKNKKVQITVPKLNHFVHRALTECGRQLWGSVFLFQSDIPSIEKQKNHRQIELLIKEGIEHSISGLLPIKSILKDNINDEDDDEEEASDLTTNEASNGGAVNTPTETKPVDDVPPPTETKTVDAQPSSNVDVQPIPTETKPVDTSLPSVTPPVIPPSEDLKIINNPSVSTMNTVSTLNQVVSKKVEIIKDDTETPIINLDVPSQVEFADMNHMHAAEENDMTFMPSSVIEDTNGTIKILDEDAGEISDIEDLDVTSPEELDLGDFETL
jgi:2-phospho-L-lactate guanylyltransferase (CobY/MobA/RfbA family)